MAAVHTFFTTQTPYSLFNSTGSTHSRTGATAHDEFEAAVTNGANTKHSSLFRERKRHNGERRDNIDGRRHSTDLLQTEAADSGPAKGAAEEQNPEDDRKQYLRKKLKEWEYAFSASHAGRKATKDDMKADGIWELYREYGLLSGRRRTSDHARPQSQSSKAIEQLNIKDTATTTPRKRTRTERSTPSKRPRHSPTPSRSPSPGITHRHGLAALAPLRFPSPSPAAEDMPHVRTPAHKRGHIDPTPQKDGRILGLFDLLPSPASAKQMTQNPDATPSKRGALLELDANMGTRLGVPLATPSKSRTVQEISTPTTGQRARYSRTPQSIGRRFLLDKFVTPSKRASLTSSTTLTSTALPIPQPSPSKTDPNLNTPAFLRRSNIGVSARLPAISEENEAASPTAKRKVLDIAGGPRKKRSLGRSLSAIIRDIRQREEDELDDMQAQMDEILAEEAQLHDTQDNTAGEGEGEGEKTAGIGAGAVSKTSDRKWKKKGAKRQTRRVILKPVMHLKAQDPPSSSSAQTSRKVNEEEESVPETQHPDNEATSDADLASDAAFIDDASDDELASSEKKASASSRKDKGSSAADTKKAGNGGKVGKAARKVNELAHANFQRLKIRSKNPKGRGRFGRR